MLNVFFNSELEKVNKKISEDINKYIKKNYKDKILFLISGGSCINILKYLNTKHYSQNISVSLLDDRFTTDKENNNFYQITKTKFFESIIKKNVNIFNTLPNKNTVENIAIKAYSEFLQKAIKNNYKIIALQGVGEDGHTAGILPIEDRELKKIFNTKEVAIAYKNNINAHKNRITTTPYFIKKYIDKSYVYIKGENKRKALKDIIESNESISANILNQIKDIKIYTDIKL